MRRSLVLTNEAARHWLRQILPPPVAEPEEKPRLENGKLFLMTFIAGFTAIYGFIA